MSQKMKNLPSTILLSKTKRLIKNNHHVNMSQNVSQSTQTNMTALYVTKTTSQQQQHGHKITVYFYLLFPPKHS